MNDFRVGDHVIISKTVSNLINVRAQIIMLDDYYNCIVIKYKDSEPDHFYGFSAYKTGNIFLDSSDEKIDIDKEYYRELKLKELGI